MDQRKPCFKYISTCNIYFFLLFRWHRQRVATNASYIRLNSVQGAYKFVVLFTFHNFFQVLVDTRCMLRKGLQEQKEEYMEGSCIGILLVNLQWV